MAKKSRRKNIILTNLPAAIALILMAVALRITLQFNFVISLLVLIVVYFILGVLIELIIDKVDTKKKKEDLFKTYAEGKSGQLPAFEDEPEEDEIAYEVKPKKEVVETSEKERRITTVGSLYETEEEESPAFLRKEESASEESAAITEEEIPEKEISMFRNSKPEPEPTPELVEESDAEPEQVSEGETEIEEETEDEDSFLNIRIADLMSEHKETSTSDRFFEETFNKKLHEIVTDTAATETISVLETEAEPEEAAVENAESETEAAAGTNDAISIDSEEVEAEPVSEADCIPEPEEDQVEVASQDAETEAQEESVEEDLSAEDMPEVPEADEALIAALKDLGAINEETQDETPAEEAEARRSLFDENDDFDAGFAERVKKNSSIIFGSVPDTDDDFEYIPVSDVGEYPVTAQKGKVKVDAKKIDDLYSFKKSKAGEKFFGRKKD